MESGILDAGATISTRRSGENPRAPELILSSWLKQLAVYDPNGDHGRHQPEGIAVGIASAHDGRRAMD